ncbi:hypothetical protein V1J52_13905 [Streptomyces sp. TRM 70351]|uniref:hypothetical protein n=1 Tax=Streptomyces sp. TRM 70351 TaxID=3116552 RepID=UPI002E7C0176|nr:hypothetical protein [Streptomyces sp. TRM 70351]MEE1929259.1 hypothetical protein [Streptomyces sp. TRM 70351]
MRFPKILIGVVAAAALTAGCGSDDGSGDGDSRPGGAAAEEQNEPSEQEDLPVAVTGPRPDVLDTDDDALQPPDEPDSSADFARKVEHKLRANVLRSAKVAGETTATCPDGVTREAGATSRCTVTYDGVEIPYEIVISDSYQEGDFLTQYKAVPKKGLLVAEAVYDTFWKQKGEDDPYVEALTCDEIPAAEAVDLNTDTGHRCQLRDEYRTTRFTVTMDSFGPAFKPIT